MAEEVARSYISDMRNALPRLAALAIIAASTVLVPPGDGAAQTVKAPPIAGARPRPGLPPVDRQIQESIARREAYQQLQQLQRQQDRDATRYRPEQLEVPVMKPACPSPTRQSRTTSNCR